MESVPVIAQLVKQLAKYELPVHMKATTIEEAARCGLEFITEFHSSDYDPWHIAISYGLDLKEVLDGFVIPFFDYIERNLPEEQSAPKGGKIIVPPSIIHDSQYPRNAS